MRDLRILIVDDEEGMLEVCEETIDSLSNVKITTMSDSAQAAKILKDESFDLLLTDIRMPGLNGIDLLRIARELNPEILVLVLTAYPTVSTAVEAMKLGATDYITKPFHPDELLATVQRLIKQMRLLEENQFLRRQLERSNSFGEMIGKSSAMQSIFQIIERVAESDIDVLVLGETGTGKELVARGIHQRSQRKKAPFVPVDCGAIPEALMESEFFGHEKGAFTGAQYRNLGLLEYAHQGFLFLDEIGQLPLGLQAKLLRALQERRIRRIGSNREIEVDVRIIAATSLNLEAEIKANRFRPDLFYRINVACIELPPLRDRDGDIPLLATTLLARYATEMGRGNVALSPETVHVLSCYLWPGNVRELQNVLRQALAMTRDSVITPDNLPDSIIEAAGCHCCQHSGDCSGFFAQRERRISNFERDFLTDLMDQCQGDAALAANQAQLPRGTLYRLLKAHHLNPADFRRNS